MIWPLLRTRRWLGFTALVLGTIVAFGLLSHWQWSRAEEKRQERNELQSALALPAAPLSEVATGAAIRTEDQWRPVEAVGTYLPEQQALVRKRPLDARNGFWVMTPLRANVGQVVWVNRGWLPAGENALATPPIPAPPAGNVTVTGYLRPFEEAEDDANAGLPAGQVAAPAAGLLPDVASAMPAYLQLATSVPEQSDLVVLPVPAIDEGRNISYAIQWLLFAAVAIGGWYFFLRREAIEDVATSAASAGTGATDERT